MISSSTLPSIKSPQPLTNRYDESTFSKNQSVDLNIDGKNFRTKRFSKRGNDELNQSNNMQLNFSSYNNQKGGSHI